MAKPLAFFLPFRPPRRLRGGRFAAVRSGSHTPHQHRNGAAWSRYPAHLPANAIPPARPRGAWSPLSLRAACHRRMLPRPVEIVIDVLGSSGHYVGSPSLPELQMVNEPMSLESPKLGGLGAIAGIASCLLAFYLAFTPRAQRNLPPAGPAAAYRQEASPSLSAADEATEPIKDTSAKRRTTRTREPLASEAEAQHPSVVHAETPVVSDLMPAEHSGVSVTSAGIPESLSGELENAVLSGLTSSDWSGLRTGGPKILRISGTMSEAGLTLNQVPTVRASARWQLLSSSGAVQAQGAVAGRAGTGSDPSHAQAKAIQHLADEITAQILNRVP